MENMSKPNENAEIENISQPKSYQQSENFILNDYQVLKAVSPAKEKSPLSARSLNVIDLVAKDSGEEVVVEIDTVENKKNLISPQQRDKLGLNERRPRRSRYHVQESLSKSPKDIPSSDPPTKHSQEVQITPSQTLENVSSSEESKIKQLSLPNLFSGCSYSTVASSSHEIVCDRSPEVLRYPCKTFEQTIHQSLLSGGSVIYNDELSEYTPVPDLYVQDPPLVAKDIPYDASLLDLDRIQSLQTTENQPRLLNKPLPSFDLIQKRLVTIPGISQEPFNETGTSFAQNYVCGGIVKNSDIKEALSCNTDGSAEEIDK